MTDRDAPLGAELDAQLESLAEPEADVVQRARESLEETLAGLKLTPEEEHALADELRQLRESASRAETLQAENTALKEAAEAAAKSMRERALADARAIVARRKDFSGAN